MATVAMGIVGAAIGSAFGNPALGWAIGTTVGGVLFPPAQAHQDVGKLDDASRKAVGASYGAAIPQIYGSGRVAGNIIWDTPLVEHASQTDSGGKGGGGSSSTTYNYTASFAVAFCRGPKRIMRIWFEDIIVFDATGGGLGDEQQVATVGSATTGSFRLTFRNATTSNIAFNASATTVQSALQALSSVGSGNCSVTGSPGGPWTVDFIGSLAGQNLPQMSLVSVGLDGSGRGVSTTRDGSAKIKIRTYLGDEVQTKDTAISADLGTANTPAYRGLCFAVFENVDLTQWSGRIPSAINALIQNADGSITYVSDILADVMGQCGLTSANWDLSTGTTTAVDGFTIGQRMPARDAVAPVLQAYAFTLAEVDGKVDLVPLNGTIQGTITADDLGAHLWQENSTGEPQTRVSCKNLDEIDLPVQVDLNYISSTNNYQTGNQSSKRFTKTDIQGPLTINLPLVFTEDAAAQLATRMLYEQWLHQGQFTFNLPPKWMQIAPGDLWTLPVNGGASITVRILKADMDLPLGPIQFEAVMYDTSVLTQSVGGQTIVSTPVPNDVTDTKLLLWSDNPLRDADAGDATGASAVGVYAGANGVVAGNWSGCQVYWSRDGGTTYTPLDVIKDAAAYGTATLLAAPSDLCTSVWDDINTVDVTLQNGSAPTSLTDLEVLSGLNGVRFNSGEVIQFGVSTALGGGVYRLSHLLRGRQGTNTVWGSHVNGEQVVFLLAGKLKHFLLPDDVVGKNITFTAPTFGQSVSDANPVTILITGNELKPWSPVDPTASAHNLPSANDWTLKWHRRTRKGGEWSDLADATLAVPDTDTYDIEVYSDGTYSTLKRTFSSNSGQSVVYTSAQQTTDFGSNQSTIYFKVYQLGRWGRGYAGTFQVTG